MAAIALSSSASSVRVTGRAVIVDVYERTGSLAAWSAWRCST
ncbi:MAG TPA: hypothetical protein VGD83_14035 [Streptosporangiaceae bacterium]